VRGCWRRVCSGDFSTLLGEGLRGERGAWLLHMEKHLSDYFYNTGLDSCTERCRVGFTGIHVRLPHILMMLAIPISVVICCSDFRPIFQMCRNSQQQPNKSQKQFPIKSPIKFTK
jgi:hypothetical protein